MEISAVGASEPPIKDEAVPRVPGADKRTWLPKERAISLSVVQNSKPPFQGPVVGAPEPAKNRTARTKGQANEQETRG